MTRKSTTQIAAAAATAAAEVLAERDSMESGDQSMELDGLPPGPDEEDFLAALRELDTGNDILWSVHKISGPQDTQGFIEKLSSSQLDMQRFRDVYGPGEYKVLGKRGGYYVKGGYKQVKISNVAYKSAAEKAAEPNLLQVLEEREERRAQARSAATKEWAAILAPLAAPIIANLFSGKNQVTELVQALGALQGLQPKLEKPPDMMSQLEQISVMMAKLKEMSGTETSTTGATWIDLVRDAIQGAKPILEGIAGRVISAQTDVARTVPGMIVPAQLPSPAPPQPAASPSGVAPSSAPQPSAAPSPAPASDPMLHLLGWLKATLDQMAYQASKDKDPEFYAEVVADNLPDGVTPQQILEYIGRSDWWPVLTQFSPAVTPYQGWFVKFRDSLIEVLNEQQPTPAPAPAPAPVELKQTLTTDVPEVPTGEE